MKKLLKNNKFYIVSALIFATGIMCIILAILEKYEIRPVYEYEIKKDSNYEIILDENNLYTDKILTSGLYYASKSIKFINIDLKYDFKANEKRKMQYKYNIYTNLIGYAKDENNVDREIWNRKFDIMPQKGKNEINEKEYKIEENVIIDYNFYNDLVESYEKKYGIVINAVLKLRFDVSSNIDISEKENNIEEINNYIELNIPITDTVTNVNESYDKVTQKLFFSRYKDVKKIILYIVGYIFVIFSILNVIFKHHKNKKNKDEQEYMKNLNRILRHNKDLIISVKNEPDLSNLKIFEINILEDLLYVAELNQTNIIHFEKVKNKQDDFYVILNDYVYVYKCQRNGEIDTF